jgi:hypothetical protein
MGASRSLNPTAEFEPFVSAGAEHTTGEAIMTHRGRPDQDQRDAQMSWANALRPNVVILQVLVNRCTFSGLA